jgi:hypothetical protein
MMVVATGFTLNTVLLLEFLEEMISSLVHVMTKLRSSEEHKTVL